MDLISQQCPDLSADDVTALNTEGTSILLQQLDPVWQVNLKDKSIKHEFSFKNYYQTMPFVNVIAQIAHQQDHHPDLLVSYNRCTVTCSTHSVNNLSIKDFTCAAKINNAQTL